MRKTTSLWAMLFGAAIILAGCNDAGPVGTEPDLRHASAMDPAAHADDEETLSERNDVKIVSATGDITAAVNEYRALLGTLNPNLAGEQPGGRREINWDGVPAALTNNDLFPGNFFNVTSPRGVLFTTDGTAFRNSSNGFVDVNPDYAGEFNTFSPPKLFVARGSTIIDVRFVVAGSNTPATVTGFGSVFADVGRARSTTIEYFDAAGNRLLKIAAPRRSDEKGLSFLGAVFDSRIVARVRITAGDTPIDATARDNVKGAGKKYDIVATDDFIYGEPRAIN
jgi:predicted small secreted protein